MDLRSVLPTTANKWRYFRLQNCTGLFIIEVHIKSSCWQSGKDFYTVSILNQTKLINYYVNSFFCIDFSIMLLILISISIFFAEFRNQQESKQGPIFQIIDCVGTSKSLAYTNSGITLLTFTRYGLYSHYDAYHFAVSIACSIPIRALMIYIHYHCNTKELYLCISGYSAYLN